MSTPSYTHINLLDVADSAHEIVELAVRDAIRVAPRVTRSFEAGPDGLELLAVGAHHPGDGEAFFKWW